MSGVRAFLWTTLLPAWPMVAGNLACIESLHRPPVVAVLTDYGSSDAYVGVLYGAILSRCPDARLAPITHEVPDFDPASASFVLGMASAAFPADTVFCTVVDPGVGTSRRSIVLRTKPGRLFVGPDNGTFTDVVKNQGLAGAWEIDEEAFAGGGQLSRTFHGRDIYGPVAGMLASGRSPQELGRRIDDPVLLPLPKPRRVGDRLEGVVRHIDEYGNIITSIPAEWLPRQIFGRRRAVTVAVGSVSVEVSGALTYGDVPVGRAVVLVNSLGVIEVARNRASAAELFSAARPGTPITITLLPDGGSAK